VITTATKFDKDDKQNGVITAKKGDLKLYQRVVAVGSMVREFKVGDLVMINAENYAKKKYSATSIQNDMDNNPTLKYEFNWVTMENEKGELEDYLMLNDRDILYSFEGEEVDEPVIQTPKLML
jgi:threonine dehydrogenase-like Zn-dependent dehydrogenase